MSVAARSARPHPAAPRLHVIQATFRGGETLVRLNLADHNLAKALALIEASLGKLEPDEKTTARRGASLDYRMVRNAGITYFLTIHQDITIHIPHDQPADQMAD
jgi:hypothetical protein